MKESSLNCCNYLENGKLNWSCIRYGVLLGIVFGCIELIYAKLQISDNTCINYQLQTVNPILTLARWIVIGVMIHVIIQQLHGLKNRKKQDSFYEYIISQDTDGSYEINSLEIEQVNT